MDNNFFDTAEYPAILISTKIPQEFEEWMTALRLENEHRLVAHFRGGLMRTWEEFYRELTAVLQFPSYCGYNWDAIEECIRELSWFPSTSYILCFSSSEYILSECPEKQEIFSAVLKDTCDYWMNPYDAEGNVYKTVPFHVVLHHKQGIQLPYLENISPIVLD